MKLIMYILLKNFQKKIVNCSRDDILNIIYEERKQFIPLSVTIELTDLCNFNCPFCYIHQNDNKSIKFRKIEEGTFNIGDDFEHAYFNLNQFITKYKDKKIEYCNGFRLYDFCAECSALAFQNVSCNKCKELTEKIDTIMEEINEKI